MPSAVEITVAETLALLDGEHASVAREVANGRYVFWLGSGISRGRVDGLPGVVERVLEFLREKAELEGAGGPHWRALEAAIDLAQLRPDELEDIDFAERVASWPASEWLVKSLIEKYAALLDITVAGQERDYLLWHAVDVRAMYPRTAVPDCEHLALAVLVLEGVLTEAPTANWDGLVEAALQQLAPGAQVQVVVLAADVQAAPGIVRLIKFHGCAVLAADDPATYRNALVARASQISAWSTSDQTAAIRGELVSLATTKPTLMIGLSAQDENIKALFGEAQARMPWSWPTDPPAHVFASDGLGLHHETILKIVYRDTYEGNEAAINDAALIRAYGAQLLTALVLQVAFTKLRAFLERCDAPALSVGDRDALGEGIRALRDLAAARAEGDRLGFMQALIQTQTRFLELFRSGKEAAAAAPYQPITDQPADRISTQAGLEATGMRELAAALGLIGRAAQAGTSSVDLAATSSGRRGALRIVTAGRESAIFFAANPRAGIELEVSGVVPGDADDVVVLHSTGPVPSMARSPSGGLGRTGLVGVREVDMFELLRDAADLPGLELRFRQEAGL